MKTKIRKALVWLLSVSMALMLVPTVISAASYSDVQGNWAQTAIEKWSDLGILQGLNGVFRPDDPITRGEMAFIIDRVMKYQTEADNSFSDLGQSLCKDAVLRVNAAGVILGNNGKVRPNDKITRQEAVVMLGRALGVKESSTSASSFADDTNISAFARGYVNAFAAAGYVSGANGKFNPQAFITRAQTVTILNNAVKTLCNEAKEYTGIVTGTVIVSVPGAVLKNMDIQGDLILSEGVGSGDVTLDHVTVSGNTIVRGGGANSIHIQGNSQLSNIIIEKTEDGAVRVVTSDGSVVSAVYVDDGCDDIILTGSFLNVTVNTDAAVRAVGATIGTLTVAAAGANLSLDQNSSVTQLTAAASAAGAQLSISGKVGTLTANAGITVNNQGTVTALQANANGVVVSGSKPISVKVADTVTEKPADGNGNPLTGGGSTGGGSSAPQIEITAVSITDGSTITFSSNTAGAIMLWNGAPIQSAGGNLLTVTGTNTITVPFMMPNCANQLTVQKAGCISYTNNSLTFTVLAPTIVDTISELTGAIVDADDGATIYVAPGSYNLTSQLVLQKPITIQGIGDVTISVAPNTTWSTDNSYKHLLSIYGRTAVSPVALSNLTLDSDGKAYGVQAYGDANAVLKDVTILNSKGAGLTVNGSTVKANGLNTSGNAWGGVNVDPGLNVTTESAFTLTGSGTLAEPVQIWSDGTNVKSTATVTVTAPAAYLPYTVADGGNANYKIWNNKPVGVSIEGTESTVYLSLPNAVTAAADGDTIYVAPGTYNLTSQLVLRKPITIQGIGDVTISADSGTVWATRNPDKHLVSIYGGTAASPVTLSHLTLDSAGLAFGVNAYDSAYAVLNDVTILNSKGAGLTVNGSTVTANGLNTSGNAWGGVNVDPGLNVTTESAFTLTGSGTIAEPVQIWSDGSHVNNNATVTVNAPVAYLPYTVADGGNANYKIWNNKPAGTSIKEDAGKVYLSLQHALTAAEDGNTIQIAGTVGSPDSFTIYNVMKPVILQGIGSEKPVIYGSFHVYADGVGFDGLEIRNKGGYVGSQAQKAAIDVLARQVSITNCDFVMGVNVPDKCVANGVTIWPLGDADFSLTMSGNTFAGYHDNTDAWSSCAFQLVENISVDTGRFEEVAEVYNSNTTTGTVDMTAGEWEQIAEGNQFSNCSNDFIYSVWMDSNDDQHYQYFPFYRKTF